MSKSLCVCMSVRERERERERERSEFHNILSDNMRTTASNEPELSYPLSAPYAQKHAADG